LKPEKISDKIFYKNKIIFILIKKIMKKEEINIKDFSNFLKKV
jgi:hypothetical protein